MCKFTNRLFAYTIAFIANVQCFTYAAPLNLLEALESNNDDVDANFNLQSLIKLVENYNDYDLHYDQRQTGKANFRKRMDGFVFVLPTDLFTDIPIPDPSHLGIVADLLSGEDDSEHGVSEVDANMERAVKLASPPAAQPIEESSSQKLATSAITDGDSQQQRKRKSTIYSVLNILKTLLKD